jgi:hypothetical protein
MTIVGEIKAQHLKNMRVAVQTTRRRPNLPKEVGKVA